MLSRWVSLCGALLLALTLFSSPLHAQIAITGISSGTSETIALPEPLTIEAANALISRLSDTQVRDLLLDQLNAQSVEIADTSDDPSLFFHHATTGAMSQVTQSIKSLPDLLSGQRTALTNFFHKFGTERILQFFGLFAFALGAALVVEFLFRRLTAKWLTLPPPDTTEQSLRKTVNRLSLRLFGELSAVFVFIFDGREDFTPNNSRRLVRVRLVDRAIYDRIPARYSCAGTVFHGAQKSGIPNCSCHR